MSTDAPRPYRTGLAVAVGGGLGALGRFAISGWVTTWAHAGFPWGTFLVNVSGSVLLGYLYRRFSAGAADSAGVPDPARAFLTVGLCGGFTTFSTFDYETLAMIHDARYALAALYSGGSVLTCIAGVYAGFTAAGMLPGRASRAA